MCRDFEYWNTLWSEVDHCFQYVIPAFYVHILKALHAAMGNAHLLYKTQQPQNSFYYFVKVAFYLSLYALH